MHLRISRTRSLSLLTLFAVFGSSFNLSSTINSSSCFFVSKTASNPIIQEADADSISEVINLNYATTTGKQQILTLTQRDHYSNTEKAYNISFSDTTTPMTFIGTTKERQSLYSFGQYARRKETDPFTQIEINSREMLQSNFSYVGGLYSNGTLIGTAFLLSNGFVLTAAHCVYLSGSYHSDLRVRFGYLGINNWEYESYVWQSFVPTSWINNCKDREEHENLLPYDWAVLQLDDIDLHETYGACTIASNRDMTNSYYASVGFPENKGGKPVLSPGYGVKKQTDTRYETYSFSYFGNSGGPVLQLNHEWNPTIQADTYFDYIVGITSSGYFNGDSISMMTYNYSGVMKITNPLIQFVEILPL